MRCVPGKKALTVAGLLAAGAGCTTAPTVERPPNVILIVANDFGYAAAGCYGQKRIQTPNLDRLAATGMRFTQYYAGSPASAASLGTLLTGQHTGHAHVRTDRTLPGGSGQEPLPATTVTLAHLLRSNGYATAAMGKWDLGGVASTGAPTRQGFDEFYGYLCQVRAHEYYPPFLWSGEERVALEANTGGAKRDYSPDLILSRALEFLDRVAEDRRFFLYLPLAAPRPSLQPPADLLAVYNGLWHERAFEGEHYADHVTPRAAHAAMVALVDRHVGRLLSLLHNRGFESDTLVLFTSDGGPTDAGGVNPAFFRSAGPFRGLSGSLHEGGLRAPLIARWPGHIRAGAVSHHLCAAWDVLPTVTELARSATPENVDGISFAPTLLGRKQVRQHGYLYWEHDQREQAVRMGPWKAMRCATHGGVALYNLDDDINETHDLAGDFPDIVKQCGLIFEGARTRSKAFPLERVDK